MRANLLEKMNAEAEVKVIAAIDRSLEPREGYELIYIEIYQAACEDLTNWLSTIKSLAGHYVSRPVYRNEADVQELVRSKRSRTDAYVIVWVKSSEIIVQPDLYDRFGHNLLKLKEGSVQLENIIRFVHDKIVYNYIDNKLIRGEHAST